MRITDSVYNSIKLAIIRHDLKPGFHLSVPALAQNFGVSRSPIREAVQKLISEGLAFEEPRKGAYVTKFDTFDLIPLFQVRLVLDGLAAELASKEISKKSLSKLKKIISSHRLAIDANDPDKYTHQDIKFHIAVLESSNNAPLKETARQIYDQIYAAMKTRVAPLGPEVTYQDHLLIFNSIVNKESKKAKKAAEMHVEHIIEQMHKITQDNQS